MTTGRTKKQQAKFDAIYELLVMSLKIKDGLGRKGKSHPEAKELAGELALQLTKDLMRIG